MTDAHELSQLLAQRRAPGADRAAIDHAIFTRFGVVKAVMFTDLVGFSRAVDAFGILHFLQLIHESEELFEPIIEAHGGVCIKHEGDSLLVLFDDAAQALATARAMVRTTLAINPHRTPEERIEVCIGLGYGTVLRIDSNEVWGAEVNAASKLGEDMARAGEILVTSSVRDAMHTEAFEECGPLFGTRKAYRAVPIG